MLIKSMLAAVSIVLFTVSPSAALTINLHFSFADFSGSFYGLVIDPLEGRQSASATSYDLSGQLDDYTNLDGDDILTNIFEFDSTTFIGAQFFGSQDRSNIPGGNVLNLTNILVSLAVDCEVTRVVSPGFGERFLPAGPCEFSVTEGEILRPDRPDVRFEASVRFETILTQEQVRSVPLPAGAILLLSSLVGLAGFKRWKKRSTC